MVGVSLAAALVALVGAEASGVTAEPSVTAAPHGAAAPVLVALDVIATSQPRERELAGGEAVLAVRVGTMDFTEHVRARVGFDGVARLTSTDAPSRIRLRDLWVELHDHERLALRLGRTRVPVGGLTMDGVLGRVDPWRGAFTLELFGGLRALGRGRQELTVRGEDAVTLPLVGGALAGGDASWQWSLAYAYSQDELVQPLGLTPDGSGGFDADGNSAGEAMLLRLERPEHAVDAFVAWRGERVTVLASATAATLDTIVIAGDAANLAIAPTVDAEPLGAIGGFVLVDLAIARGLGVQLVGDVRDVAPVVVREPEEGAAAAPSERRADVIFKLRLHPVRALRVGLRSRLRLRDDDTREVRGELAVSGERLVGGLGVSATFGLDRDVGDDPVVGSRRIAEDHTTLSGALTWQDDVLDASLGVLYTDGIGTDAALSAIAARTLAEGPRSRLFPLSLETAQIAFLRAFWTGESVFAGVDVEVDLDGEQVRSLLQIGLVL